MKKIIWLVLMWPGICISKSRNEDKALLELLGMIANVMYVYALLVATVYLISLWV